MARDRQEHEDGALFLGIVDRITRSDQPLAWLRPLYEASSDSTKWARRIENRSSEFPNRGEVAWFRPPDAVSAKTFWQFSIDTSPTFSPGNPSHALYRAVNVSELIPVVDGRSFATNDDDVRSCLTETGILLARAPQSRVYIRLHGNKWAGPAKLIQRGRGWLLDPEFLEEPFRVFAMTNPEGMIRFDFDGPTVLPGPNSRTQQLLGMLDWAPDPVVLRRVLRRLHEFDTTYASQLQLTAAAADRIAESLGNDSAVLDTQLDGQRLKRVKRFVSRLAERADLVSEVVDALIMSDAIKSELEQRRAEILETYRREAQSAITRDTEAARRELENLGLERESLNAHVNELRSEVDRLQARLDARVDGFESALRDRLSEIAANPERSFAEFAAVRALLGPERKQSGIAPVIITAPTPGVAAKRSPSGEEHERAGRDLRQLFARAALAPALADALHSTFVAGSIPLLFGERSFSALSLYASRLAGGRVLWTPVSGDVASTGQFLGSVRVGGNCDEVATGSLLEFLSLASTRDELHIAVLDGINLAPIEVYLLPILNLYRDAWIGRTPRTLRFETATGRPVDMAWPRNVLLAGIFREGPAALPVPKSAWGAVVFVDLESFELPPSETEMHPDDRETITSAWPVTSISLTAWESQRRMCPEQDFSDAVALWDEAREKFRLPGSVKDEVIRLYTAGCVVTGKDFALTWAIRAMLPHVAGQMEAFAAWITERRVVSALEARVLADVRKWIE
jgi:hypothetical protein